MIGKRRQSGKESALEAVRKGKSGKGKVTEEGVRV